MSSNPEYKSDVFSMLLENPEYSLSVYNALNHSDYRDPSEIQVYKLENGIHLSLRNDASFIIDSYLSLYEHQTKSRMLRHSCCEARIGSADIIPLRASAILPEAISDGRLNSHLI